jgi:hypothetical protein
MKRIFSNPVVPLLAGLCLRLLFVLKFPANSGDTVLYEQIAANWVQHHVYAMNVHNQVTPVDMRVPGYPAFLALIYALTGRAGEAARLWVMLSQVIADLLSCVLIAALAWLLALIADERLNPRRVFAAALWLAALCPLTANYAAVPLTEVFAILLTTAALLPLTLLVTRTQNRAWRPTQRHWAFGNEYWHLAMCAGLLTGLCTLFRPETPLLLLTAISVLAAILIYQRETLRWARTTAILLAFCAIPLVPWTIRNALTLHEFQPLAPKNSNLPGELVPYGLMSWEKTWLFRFRDVYLVPWKLNDEVIDVDQIPSRAFDSPAEKERVAMILDEYNNELTLTPEEDAAFLRLARERTERKPLRTYLWLPLARGITLWFTPRIELLPVSGTVFPLGQSWEDDPVDQSVTIGFFLLNLGYLALSVWGAIRLWREAPGARAAIILLGAFVLVRTAFLTTLETPEPRYVLVCFPAILALGAQTFAPAQPQELQRRTMTVQPSTGSG